MDADHFAIQIEQRAAGVCTDQCAVGIDDAGTAVEDPASAKHWRAVFAIAARMSEQTTHWPGFRLAKGAISTNGQSPLSVIFIVRIDRPVHAQRLAFDAVLPSFRMR